MLLLFFLFFHTASRSPPAMALRATLGGAPHFGNHCTKASETWSWALIWMSHFSKLSYVVVSGRYNTQNLPTCLLPEIQQRGQLHKDKQAKGPMRNIPWSKWKLTFWSLDGGLSSQTSQTRHEGKTSPWLSEQSPLDLHGPAPPENHKLHCQNSHFKDYRRLHVINVEIC